MLLYSSANMYGIGFKELAFVSFPVTNFPKNRKFCGGILGLKEGASSQSWHGSSLTIRG